MQILSLTLKGFRGIRDGLGLDTLALDFEGLCNGAELVAIAGANGRGKSTVLDNMHPYLTMPSRAAAGGFSYYDHVFLSENEKDLIWALGGRCYRSQVVIRLNGRRRTEAFLSELCGDGAWRPVVLADGTIADGKVDTYTRCVERLCGSADTFFTSAFGAQGKRQLGDYRNAEIKTLMADLLGQDRIREIGRLAGDTVRLLKAGLVTVRQAIAAMEAEAERLARAREEAADAPVRAERARAAMGDAMSRMEEARCVCARIVAQRDRSGETDARRLQLHAERRAAQAAGRLAAEELADRERAERLRLERLDQRLAQRAVQVERRREHLLGVQAECRASLAGEPQVRIAVRRLPLAERVLELRSEHVRRDRERAAAWVRTQAALRLLTQRIQGIEREAGQAALRARALARRFELAAEVPCYGTPLQQCCKLLGDAREAQALIPSAEGTLRRLAREKAEAEHELRTARTRAETLAAAESALTRSEQRRESARARASRLALFAAKAEDMTAARQRMAAARTELASLEAPAEDQSEREEREAIAASLHAIEAQRGQQADRLGETLGRLDAVLATLPAPFDGRSLSGAEAARDRAIAAHEAAQRLFLETSGQAHDLAALRQQQTSLAERRAAAQRQVRCIENAVGDWTLLARCMSNDGLIALVIDDAGPALSALANDLLLACYGPRFTVSILTQTETATGGKREDFDILVHDAESDESKSVRSMSGGERVWINECLVRAVALYLAQTSDRRYETLFSDEADGALDPERKRMFGAMKREVLRLGGYRREFFVSQAPELAAMADIVIDLDARRAAEAGHGTLMS